jgi:methionine synthase II (cobalamin-independent)
MIKEIHSLPDNLVGFEAHGEVTSDDFREVVMPRVEALIQKQNKINYLLILHTEVANFTVGAWVQDVWMGLKDLFKWNRAAIVTDEEIVKTVTQVFTKVMVGEFKVFKHHEVTEAIKWASEQTQGNEASS